MADLETTQSKLRSTPTAGVSGEHSAYYRRLLSAGYKGYIQGSIGGGTLYGSIGLGIGTIAALAMAPFTGAQSLWLIPVLGGSFGLYGAHAFADIGKTAAIIADSADTNEKRRYLLDRYYETPSDKEAAEIKRQLEDEHLAKKPTAVFHWRPALMGAAIGVAVAVVSVLMISHGIAPHFMAEGFSVATKLLLGHEIAANSIVALSSLGGLAAVGSLVGALAGSVIGIDREYIRRWLDKSEFVVHEPEQATQAIAARERDIQRLTDAAKQDQPLAEKQPVEKIALDAPGRPPVPALERERRPDPMTPHAIAGVVAPDNKVHAAQLADRIVTQMAQQGV